MIEGWGKLGFEFSAKFQTNDKKARVIDPGFPPFIFLFLIRQKVRTLLSLSKNPQILFFPSSNLLISHDQIFSNLTFSTASLCC